MYAKRIIEYYFKKYIDEGFYSYYHNWYHNFSDTNTYIMAVINEVKNGDSLKETIEKYKNDDIANPRKGSSTIKDIDSFYYYYWKIKDNGVADLGQGVFYKEFYELAKYSGSDDEFSFYKLNEYILKNYQEKDLNEIYQTVEKWFKNQKDNGRLKRMSWSSLNRFFSTIWVGEISTIASMDKLDFIFNELGIEKKGNWIESNRELMKYIIPLEEKLKNDENEELFQEDKYKCIRSMFFWYLYEKLSDPTELKKQIIYYGSPGTGKTYQARELSREKYQIWSIRLDRDNTDDFNKYYEFVQFHPSYTYEDFIEGIRPDSLQAGQASLKLRDGIFKSFCKRAAVWELDYYDKVEESKRKDFSEVTVEDIINIPDINENLWRDVLRADYKNDDQILKYIPPFFFLIDEINRAELSRVFGELMYCLEYRGYEGMVKTQYSNLADFEKTKFFQKDGENYFFIPHNLYLLGTMNTIDRSVESFDFALRRRFTWKRKDYDISALKQVFRIAASKDSEVKKQLYKYNDNNIVRIADALERLNNSIKKEPLLGIDYQIGHAYLFDITRHIKQGNTFKDAMEMIWELNILPLLEEYLRGLGDSLQIENILNKFYEDFLGKKEE